MELNVAKEVANLRRMTVGELRARYADAFGEVTNTRHREWLVRRIAWRLQALAEGELSVRARQRASELANDADLRVSAPKTIKVAAAPAQRTRTTDTCLAADNRLPMPGTIITRQYKGETLQVRVLADGFEYEGDIHKSLSAVAKTITGSHCNGYLFFRLGGRGGAK